MPVEAAAVQGAKSRPPERNTDHSATRPRSSSARLQRWLPFALIAPALLVEIIVHFVPMVLGVYLGFLRLNQFTLRRFLDAPWAGLENFQRALDFSSPIGRGILTSFLVTLSVTVTVTALSWCLGMGAALLLNDARLRGRGVLRVLFLIPYIIPAYVSAIAFRFMLQRDTGSANALLVDGLGLWEDRPFWLLGSNAWVSLVLAETWRLWPFAFLFLMAGLQTVPVQLYEAARMDGAGAWRRFTSVTLPSVRPVSGLLLLVTFLWTFNDFSVPVSLLGGTPPEVADMLAPHIYNTAFANLNYGLGSALSSVMLVFLVLVTALYWRFAKLGRGTDA